jgi:DNA polymerase (family 10)
MPAPGERLPLRQARDLAYKVRDALIPHCRRIEIAGSIRRQRETCGDIDIVCLPAGLTGREAILARCKQGATLLKEGEQYVEFRLANGFQLDLWFAHDGTGDLIAPEPSNYGALLLARTGSAFHNIWIADRARAKGLRFSPSRGLTRDGKVVASAEEAEIFRTLGLPFVQPWERERP